MVPYICLYKTVCDLSYRCIWYPIFVYIRQCVTCLIDVYGPANPIFVYIRQCVTCLIDVYGTIYICYIYKTVCDLSYRCIWYPIFVYIRQCVTCLIDVYGTLYLFI